MPSHELLISEIPLYAKNSDNGKLFVLKDVSEIHRLEESVRRRLYQEQNIARYDFSHIVGKSPALQKVLSLAQKWQNQILQYLFKVNLVRVKNY